MAMCDPDFVLKKFKVFGLVCIIFMKWTRHNDPAYLKRSNFFHPQMKIFHILQNNLIKTGMTHSEKFSWISLYL